MTDAAAIATAGVASPFALPTPEDLTAQLQEVVAAMEDEIEQACARLSGAAAGERLAIMVQLALRRSVQYASGYRAYMLTQARQMQRQRGELVRQLQRRAGQLLRPSLPYRSAAARTGVATVTAASSPSASAPAADPLESFRSVWDFVGGAIGAEAAQGAVRMPIRPPLAALRQFLTVAVRERRLHHRVAAGLRDDDSPRTPDATATAVASSTIGGGGSDTAIAEALNLLLDAIDAHTVGMGMARFRTRRHRADSSSPSATATKATAQASASTFHREDHAEQESGPTLCVPMVLSLGQYCADAPWVTTHDAATEDERQRRKRSNPNGDEDVADRIGYLFNRRAVAEGREGPTMAVGDHGCPAAAATLRSGRVESSLRAAASLWKSGAGGDDRSMDPAEAGDGCTDALHTQAHTVAAYVTALVDGHWSDPVHEKAIEELMLAVLHEDRDTHERKATADVVDVDGPSSGRCEQTANTTAQGASGTANGLRVVGSAEEESELSAMQSFLDVVRALYSVELTARVLALHTAGKLLLESSDAVCFDGFRCVQLCVSPVCPLLDLPHGPTVATKTTATSPVAAAGVAAIYPPPPPGESTLLPAPGLSASALLPVTVFNLPETENVFYCIAVTIGLALLRDCERACGGRAGSNGVTGSPTSLSVPSKVDFAGDRLNSCAINDNDDDDAHDEEEEAHRLRAAGVSSKAVRGQRRADTWLSALEEEYLSTSTANRTTTTFMVQAMRDGAPSDTIRQSLAADSLPFAAALRLWRYLWEHVFTPDSADDRASTTDAAAGALGVVPREAQGMPLQTDASASSLPTPLAVPHRRVRRWLDAQVTATLEYGVRAAHLIVSAPRPTVVETAYKHEDDGALVETEVIVAGAPAVVDEVEARSVGPSWTPLVAAAGVRVREETARLWRSQRAQGLG